MSDEKDTHNWLELIEQHLPHGVRAKVQTQPQQDDIDAALASYRQVASAAENYAQRFRPPSVRIEASVNTDLLHDSWAYAIEGKPERVDWRLRNNRYSDNHSIFENLYAAAFGFRFPSPYQYREIPNPESSPELVALLMVFVSRLKLDKARFSQDDSISLSVRELAFVAGMRESSIRNAISSGEIHDTFNVNGRREISAKSAEEWLKTRRNQSHTKPACEETQANIVAMGRYLSREFFTLGTKRATG